MIISPFALWFVIGAVVAIYSLIDDLFISKNKEVIMYVIHKHRPNELSLIDDERLYKCLMAMFVIVDTLFGPVAIYGFFRKSKAMRKFRAEMQNK